MSAPYEEGEQSSSAPPTTSNSSTSTTTTSITLPSISAFYNLTPTTTVSSGPEQLIHPSPPAPIRFPTSTGADDTSWITPANTAELAEDDDLDNDYYDDTNFVFENGRRYHANADGRVLYPLPNDESEQERDDMKHKLALWMMHEKLFYAPVEEELTQGGLVFDLGESRHYLLFRFPKLHSPVLPFLTPPSRSSPSATRNSHGYRFPALSMKNFHRQII